MPRDQRVLRVIKIWIERIVRDAAQTGVPLIDAGRFLIRVGVRGIEHQAVGVTPLDLSLKNVCLAIAVTTVSQQIVAEFRVWKASIICRGRKAVSVIYGARGQPSPVVVPQGVLLGAISLRSMPPIRP